MAAIDRLNGLASETTLGIKAPVLVATTANITLAGAQAIDGVTVGNNSERVLVKNQTDPRQNGIYIASSGNWIYAQDAGGNTDWAKGTIVAVTEGTENSGALFQQMTLGPIIIGTSSLVFAPTSSQLQSAALSFDTLAEFLAASLPGIVVGALVIVRAVTGTYPPAAGLEATPLTYRRVLTSTGLFGEITVSGQLFAPVYSTNPVNVGEFGAIGDASFVQGTNYLTATADGSNVLTTANTAGVPNGANIGHLSWHSFGVNAIPTNTTVLSSILNTSITLSHTVVAGSNMKLIWWTESLTGTDNTVAIQAAIDFALQNGYPDIRFPLGKYLVSDTLQAGWGDGFYELHFRGVQRQAFSAALPGVSLFSSKVDRPLLNFQGMRAASWRGISIQGRNYQYTQFAQGFSNLMSSDPLDWLDPRFVPTGNNSGGIALTAPYAGITQDAYSGSKPTIHYPDRVYPAWVIAKGYSTQYGASLSSDIEISDCSIEGFGVQIASGLAQNSQGDFLKMNRLTLTAGAYGASIGNSQSRNVEFRNINGGEFHTLLSGTNLGQRDGELVGPIDNVSMTSGYQLFDFQSLSISGPLNISNLYCENQVRIGNFIGSTSFPGAIHFFGGLLDFQNVNNYLPGSLITNGNFGGIVFEGTSVNYAFRIANIQDGFGNLTIKGGSWQTGNANVASTAQQRAHNYSGAFLPGDARFNVSGRNQYRAEKVSMSYWPTVSGGINNYFHDREIQFNTSAGTINRAPMSPAATEYTDQFHRRWRMTVTPEAFIAVTSPLYTNDTMTFLYPNAAQTGTDVMQRITAGDILYHIESGTIFIVNSIGSPSGGNVLVTSTQQNNLQVDGSNVYVANLNPIPGLAGETVIIKTGAVIPKNLHYGTFTSGSTAVASISDGTGTSSMATPSTYVAGDLLIGLAVSVSANMPYQQWPIAPGTTISSVTDGTPGSAVLSANAIASGVYPLFPYELR